MKKLLFSLLTLLSFAIPSYAQQGVRSHRFTIAGPDSAINLVNTAIAWHQLTWSVSGTASACMVALDTSTNGTTWSSGGAITGQTCTSNGSSSVVNVVARYVRINMTALTITAGSSVTVTWDGWTSNPGGGGGGSVSITATLPITVTPNPITGAGDVECPSCTATFLPTGVDTGAIANAYIVNPSTAVTLTPGAAFTFTTTRANTGAATMNASGTGPVSITNYGIGFVGSGQIQANTLYQMIYDGTYWNLQGGFTNPATPGSPFALPTGAFGSQGFGSPMTLYSKQMDTGGVDRTMLNFICVGAVSSGCNAGNNSRASFGFDGDNVFIFDSSGPAMAFEPLVENFNRWQWQSQFDGGVDLTIDPGITKTSGDALCVGNGGGGSCATPLFEVASVTGKVTAPLYGTRVNCSSAASPAVCTTAAAGSIVVAAGATTVQVNTSAVTANSQIFIQFDSSLSTKLGVTCNATFDLGQVTARSAGASFTITSAATPAVNPACYSYFIVN